MAESRFEVVYKGPALEVGQMEVRDLAPALLALGELFVAASMRAYPDREPVGLQIRATSSGSFLVQLVLHSPDAWDQAVHLFSSPAATALSNLKELVIGAGFGAFWLVKRLRGRRIEREETAEVSPGMVRLVLDDGTSFEVPLEVLGLYRSRPAREQMEDVVKPLERDGIREVTFRSEGPPLTITETDLPAFEVPVAPETQLPSQELDLTLEVLGPEFDEGDSWRFSDGEREFTARVDDAAFLDRVRQGESFRKGDTLTCRVAIEQSLRSDGRPRSAYRVVRVTGHNSQLSLDAPANEPGRRTREPAGPDDAPSPEHG